MISNFMLKKIINHKKYLFIFIISILFLNLAKSDEIYLQGKKIFLGQGNCAACHTLKDAKSTGNIGPNLNEIKPGIEKVISSVKNGIGVMPAFEGQLSNEEIQAVSYYVSVSTNTD